MSKNIITVIIPIFNTPIVDLERCFNNLFFQTCKDFKIIAVDDGSNVETKNCLNSLCKKCNNLNLKVFHKDNTGLPDTKDFGLKYVDTEYVCFCDSDDTYNTDFIEKCYYYLDKFEVDLICGNINFIPKWNSQIPIDRLYFFDNIENVICIKESMFEFMPRVLPFNVSVGSWGKLYKTKLVNEVLFDKDVTFGEDQLFNRKYLMMTKSALLVPDFFYNYYQNEYAMTRKLLKEIPFSKYKPFWDRMYELDKMEDNRFKQNIYAFNIRLLNGYVNRACAANNVEKFMVSLKKVNEAISHPLINTAIKNARIFSKTISLLNSINVLILRLKMNWLYLLEKKIIYFLHINKDKI